MCTLAGELSLQDQYSCWTKVLLQNKKISKSFFVILGLSSQIRPPRAWFLIKTSFHAPWKKDSLAAVQMWSCWKTTEWCLNPPPHNDSKYFTLDYSLISSGLADRRPDRLQGLGRSDILTIFGLKGEGGGGGLSEMTQQEAAGKQHPPSSWVDSTESIVGGKWYGLLDTSTGSRLQLPCSSKRPTHWCRDCRVISADRNVEQPAFRESAACTGIMMQCHAANGRKRAPSVQIEKRKRKNKAERYTGEKLFTVRDKDTQEDSDMNITAWKENLPIGCLDIYTVEWNLAIARRCGRLTSIETNLNIFF